MGNGVRFRRLWRQEALGIRELADIVDAPEHRLRKLINESLCYRNFAAFLNERRIGAAQRVLSDPSYPRTQVGFDDSV
jgi:hypothetical protein